MTPRSGRSRLRDFLRDNLKVLLLQLAIIVVSLGTVVILIVNDSRSDPTGDEPPPEPAERVVEGRVEIPASTIPGIPSQCTASFENLVISFPESAHISEGTAATISVVVGFERLLLLPHESDAGETRTSVAANLPCEIEATLTGDGSPALTITPDTPVHRTLIEGADQTAEWIWTLLGSEAGSHILTLRLTGQLDTSDIGAVDLGADPIVIDLVVDPKPEEITTKVARWASDFFDHPAWRALAAVLTAMALLIALLPDRFANTPILGRLARAIRRIRE